MTKQATRLFGSTLSLILAGAFVAQAETYQYYVDDGHELLDVETADKAVNLPGLEPLAEGLEPLFIEPAMFEPDDLGTRGGTDKGLKSDTGPLVGSNTITIYISNDHVNAGSNTSYILVRFGQRSGNDDGSTAYEFRLGGYAGTPFPRGATMTYDLTGMRDFLEDMPQDNWDQISFKTPSGDGILIRRVRVVHSGEEILDWTVNRWLDSPNETTLGCAAKITERKLDHVGHSDHAAIHFAALEIGKTDGYKYGTGRLWCSEFASWALFKEGFMPPAGNIGTDDMKAWFADRGRLYTRSQVKAKTYVPKEGDYMSINDGGHSVIFFEWVDPTTTITDSTRFRSIEGNSSQTVHVVTRTVSQIDRVGKAQ